MRDLSLQPKDTFKGSCSQVRVSLFSKATRETGGQSLQAQAGHQEEFNPRKSCQTLEGAAQGGGGTAGGVQETAGRDIQCCGLVDKVITVSAGQRLHSMTSEVFSSLNDPAAHTPTHTLQQTWNTGAQNGSNPQSFARPTGIPGSVTPLDAGALLPREPPTGPPRQREEEEEERGVSAEPLPSPAPRQVRRRRPPAESSRQARPAAHGASRGDAAPAAHKSDGAAGRRRARGGGGRRAAANARERDRTHSVNTAFGALRRLIPTRPADRRLSKVETLRLASSYISHLANVLLLQQRRQDEAVGAEQPCPQPAQPCPQPCSPPGASAPRSICTFCLSDQRQRHREREKPSPAAGVTGL
ncbi:pancreas transcription factor 1 subunit alpha-like isoform X2 [Passer montanus]|uniref:pancreas transcription factor 1 subunit alpha-like isoform X2 n=1 Tax=Passer montanus TaxID=9160 RepID=UPI0019611D43|nr:pancreas transcription factor 1 subunit alpha-like isoform X2 [Passer montanus]